MKIAILVDEIAPGSGPKTIGQTVRGLESLGHSCEVLSIVRKNHHNKYPSIYDFHLKDVKIRYLLNELPFPFIIFNIINFKFPGFSFFSTHHILSFLIAPLVVKKREFDIIIAHCQYSSFAAWSLKIIRKIPYLLLVWDPSTYTLHKIYRNTWLRFFYPILYVLSVALDRFSTKGAEALITSGKLHHNRFKTISGKPLEDLYPGCFLTDRFVPYNQRMKAILTYDRWDIGNKPHSLLNLLENIDSDIKLIIGGFWHPQTIEKDFLEEVKKRKLEYRVELFGPMNENDILELCSRVILHVHDNEEAFGMQTLEAAACGCSIIIPKGSGVTDLFEHGVHGYFPQKQNFEELLQYTRMVFSDLKKAETMGCKARDVAINYTWNGYVRQLEKIIKKYVK